MKTIFSPSVESNLLSHKGTNETYAICVLLKLLDRDREEPSNRPKAEWDH